MAEDSQDQAAAEALALEQPDQAEDQDQAEALALEQQGLQVHSSFLH